MEALKEIEKQYTKPKVAAVQSGDTVRVHQLIREGSKKRVQVFEGVIIRTHRLGSMTAVITVRRIASGVGVEKTFMLHSPNVQKVEVLRRAKVRRNFLSYLRGRRGKSARLTEQGFDKLAVNVEDAKPEAPKAESTDEAADAEVTEISTGDDSIQSDGSTDEVAKTEEKAASDGDEAQVADDAGEEGDEGAAPAEEIQEGLDKANKEDDSAQGTT
jgi:large subunit ribosomal protein L19